MIVNYELTSWGNRDTGEAHYLVDGVAVTQAEYERCLLEYQSQPITDRPLSRTVQDQ